MAGTSPASRRSGGRAVRSCHITNQSLRNLRWAIEPGLSLKSSNISQPGSKATVDPTGARKSAAPPESTSGLMSGRSTELSDAGDGDDAVIAKSSPIGDGGGVVGGLLAGGAGSSIERGGVDVGGSSTG